MKTERDATEWWQEHAKEFPNVAVMARQYLGCPSSSAAVERLFFQVGIAFAAKSKSASAATLERRGHYVLAHQLAVKYIGRV